MHAEQDGGARTGGLREAVPGRGAQEGGAAASPPRGPLGPRGGGRRLRAGPQLPQGDALTMSNRLAGAHCRIQMSRAAPLTDARFRSRSARAVDGARCRRHEGRRERGAQDAGLLHLWVSHHAPQNVQNATSHDGATLVQHNSPMPWSSATKLHRCTQGTPVSAPVKFGHGAPSPSRVESPKSRADVTPSRTAVTAVTAGEPWRLVRPKLRDNHRILWLCHQVPYTHYLSWPGDQPGRPS